MSRRQLVITPSLMLRAYRAGLFPMAETRRGQRLYWLDPERRGVLPLDHRFHAPRRLLRTVRSGPYRVTADTAFGAVLAGCAAAAPGREDTWINDEIEALFLSLFASGSAHSVECWLGDRLVGGLYGIAIGGTFFGESMFSVARDASKVALVHLVARLRLGGFTLLDTQFLTAHLAQFGAAEQPRASYKLALAASLEVDAAWPDPSAAELDAAVQAMRAAGEQAPSQGVVPP